MALAMVHAQYIQQIADALRIRGVAGNVEAYDEDSGTTIEEFSTDYMAEAIAEIDTAPPVSPVLPPNKHGDKYVLLNHEDLAAIADAIREKNYTQNTYTVAQMANAILAIDGTVEPPTPEPDYDTDYTNYSFEVIPYLFLKNSASDVWWESGYGVRAQYSAQAGTNMVRFYSVVSGHRYLIFDGSNEVESRTGYLAVGVVPYADVTSHSEIMSCSAWAELESYEIGVHKLPQTNGTLCVKYSDTLRQTTLHVIDFTAMLSAQDASGLIISRYARTVNGSHLQVDWDYDDRDGFVYGATGNYVLDYFHLTAGHTYRLFYLSDGGSFGLLLCDRDLSTRTSNYLGTFNILGPSSGHDTYTMGDRMLSNIDPDEEYLVIQQSTTGNTNFEMYLIDITDFE